MHGFLAVVAILVGGCPVTTTTCPTGTKLIAEAHREGRTELCAVRDTTQAELPTLGRSFADDLGIGHPAAMPGGVDGPYTSWYPTGALRSHGRYVDFGARSVPDGLWVFWRPDGQRWVMGVYHRGEPVDCFAEWDEHGAKSTGTVQGDQLHVAPCTPPPDDEVAIVEGHAQPDDSPAWADVSVHGFAGPNHLGAANDTQIENDPSMTLAFGASARVRIGRRKQRR